MWLGVLHRNHEKLDYRRQNLRSVSAQENLHNHEQVSRQRTTHAVHCRPIGEQAGDGHPVCDGHAEAGARLEYLSSIIY